MAKEKKPSDKLADKTALTKFLQGVFGDAQKKVLKKLWKKAQIINDLEPKYEKMSVKDLKAQTEKFKKRLEKESLDKILSDENIILGYKFANQNAGTFGKKISLPMYMLPFI